MRPKKPATTSEGDLFRARLEQIINLKHELVQLLPLRRGFVVTTAAPPAPSIPESPTLVGVWNTPLFL